MAGALDGKIAIVTGGGSGIGRATTQRFVAEGADVLVVDVNADGAAETKSLVAAGPGRCAVTIRDITDADAPAAVFRTCTTAFGRPDILVNNAGIGASKPVHLTEDEALDRFTDINLRALFRLSREAVAAMRGHGGSIVNLASIYGIRGFAGSSIYSATKAAVIGLTQNMAADYGPDGIRVNAIAPGLIDTPLSHQRIQTMKYFQDGVVQQMPLGRPGKPEDVAAAITFLCSEDAGFITGHVLAVDGGWSATKFRPFSEDEAHY